MRGRQAAMWVVCVLVAFATAGAEPPQSQSAGTSPELQQLPGNAPSLTARDAAHAARGDRTAAGRDDLAALAATPGYGAAVAGPKELDAPRQATAVPVLEPARVALPGQGWQGPFPYVEQGYGTCWATTARMMIRAYGGNASVFDLLTDMRAVVDVVDRGGGLYGVANDSENFRQLTAVMNRWTPGPRSCTVPARPPGGRRSTTPRRPSAD